MSGVALVKDADEAREVVATIKDAERVAEREARASLERARVAIKTSVLSELRPVADSPLYGNGLHKGLVEALATARELDNALQRLEQAVQGHFHGGDES